MAMLTKGFATYEADGAIAKGQAVKFGSSNKRMTPCAATTDLCVGVAQNVCVNAGDLCEVVLSGGAKGLAQAAITKGNRLGVNASGAIQKVATQGDMVIGIALDDASAADIFSMMVIPGGAAFAAQA